ncbi:alpha/beta fold hydrolase [Bifidobacterium sp. SMB2]|uniref:Alpha/beta fold hydrolase n=1 Tax=Bifidobacterium saimiriisciurei TaxID=2661627 RepID=A0ABX0CA37_9BIFI|nr:MULTISPECIES: alpha/beta fold hydrolase [Bifidobacterium]NEG96904.1 alpha/beta fold hydrolase [Bifidobacterium sp. SMB2]NEH11566.1 alpha/beta fold hydrolase [Bifidobacterium saimiriisciurei]
MTRPKANMVIRGNETQGDGIPVVFVHGLGVDHRSLMLLDDVFPEPTRRIYLDLPGFGKTPALDGAGGLPEMADWLQSIIDDIVGPRTAFAMVGNSMGGALAREILARESERVLGLALIAPVVDPRHAHRRVGEHVIADPNPKLTHALPQEQVFDFITMGVNQSFEAWRRYQRFILPGVRLCDREACRRLGERYFLNDVPEQVFGTFGGPTLIVTGHEDQIVGYEDQRALLPHYPNTRFVVLDNAGHNLHIDRPKETGRLLTDWAGKVVKAV